MGKPSKIIITSEHFYRLAERFYRHLLQLGYHPKSCRSQYHYLREFLSWLETKGKERIEKITSEDIARYYDYISQRPNKTTGGILNPKTTHAHMRIVRDLFELLVQEKQITQSPCSALRFPYPKGGELRVVLSWEQTCELYRASQNAQERAILSLSYGCGLRVGELVGCNVGDIRLRERILIVPKGKGNKRRVVPMSSLCRTYLVTTTTSGKP
ncbi:MAG: tyrosine-type recombinase/integrase [Flavobacteriales bacterium]|nr:tyrosine-type recombinase/integrase [Flavobacteriales bacterium]